MAKLTQQLIERMMDELRKEDSEEAAKHLTALEAYKEKFERFRGDLVTLHSRADSVWQQVQGQNAALSRDKIDVLHDTDTLLMGKPFSLEDQRSDHIVLDDEQGTKLISLQSKIQPLMDRLEALQEIDDHILTMIEKVGKAISKAPSENLRTSLEAKRQELEDLRNKLPWVRETSKLEELDQEALTVFGEGPGTDPDDVIELAASLPQPRSRLRGTTRTLDMRPKDRQEATLPLDLRGARQRYKRLDAVFRQRDLRMTLIAGLLAVALGLSTLYFTNASWGLPADYLAAFLWGSIVSEGLKYVGNIVARVAPGT